MKILLFGKNGQVGWELQRSLAPLGEVITLGSDGLNGMSGDFTDLTGIGDTVRRVAPDIIVNAAAHTAVDKAESEPGLARTINAAAPALLAKAAAQSGAWLIHYSTDYVFDGSGGSGWQEDSPTGPLGVYGQTKLEGEQAITASGCKHVIFRTSWVYGSRGSNFAKTMLRLGAERDHLTVIDDQIGAPTGADLIADVTALALRSALARPELSGLYHLAAAGETSWHGYARFVLDHARQAGVALQVTHDQIKAVPTSAFPTAAQRPKNSRLDTGKLQSAFGLVLPAWQTGVTRNLTEILQGNHE